MYIPSPLEVEKNKLTAIISNLNEAIIIVDLEQKITTYNKAAEDLIGISHGQAIGQFVGDIVKFFDADEEISPDTYCPANEFDIEGIVFGKDQINIVDKDNNLKLVNVQSRKIKGGASINLSCILIIQNVNDVGEFEKMKLDFVSMSVHTLRTPVTILRGFLSSLSRPETLQKLDDSEKESLTNAIKGSTELKDLIEKLLNMAELQQSRFNANAISFDYEELVRITSERYKAKAVEKGLNLEFLKPIYRLPFVKADFKMLEEVLERILDNALKYTDSGTIQVALSIEGEEIKTSIIDTGRGIPQKNLPHLFNKFYRVKTNALEMEYGTGASLYICKKVIEAYKGRIWVESTEGKGTIFTFLLPVDKTQNPKN